MTRAPRDDAGAAVFIGTIALQLMRCGPRMPVVQTQRIQAIGFLPIRRFLYIVRRKTLSAFRFNPGTATDCSQAPQQFTH
ncbi:hypothetical protein BSU04_14395 [Caballeronia sordidicola]|uniref:Uncharacterized protein n=1 Tax=Caballeronia sordidicola TaxID=196367 RepID=A0A226X3A4_CABSO|nr:hypothetical protein BSU04_14395 [Caballeronia sordidicola]